MQENNQQSTPIPLQTPLSDDAIRSLKAGDAVSLSGVVYTARDAAHERLVDMANRGETMPFDFQGQAVFYAGPAPAKPGKPIGSVGPTTGGRMDAYSPQLIERGLKIMIGKGGRSEEVVEAIKKHEGIYFAAVGGIAALMARSVESSVVIAFDELGTEAIRKLRVVELPVIVAIDHQGNNLYESGPAEYSERQC